MLYLITTEQRKKIIDEYQARIWLVSAIVLVLLVIIFFVLAIPSILSIRAESQVLADKLTPLEKETVILQSESTKEGALALSKDLAILQLAPKENLRTIYNDITEVFEGVSGVVVQKITIDTLTKTVSITSLVRDKNVARSLVEHIMTTKYKGANLPYTILSEKASFVFNQKLTYENF